MFILAKSRLVPLKERFLAIPKLELQAAVIAARIKETVLHEISFHPRAIFLGTDSKTVIWRIQNQKGHHFPLFIMHPIYEIRQLSQMLGWYYMPSDQNPARLVHKNPDRFLINSPEIVLWSKNYTPKDSRSKGDQY